MSGNLTQERPECLSARAQALGALRTIQGGLTFDEGNNRS